MDHGRHVRPHTIQYRLNVPRAHRALRCVKLTLLLYFTKFSGTMRGEESWRSPHFSI